MDVFDSLKVSVHNSLFQDNGPVTINKGMPFRGHSGGLSISFTDKQPVKTHKLLIADIRDSIFRNNSVHASKKASQTTSELLRKFMMTGRGGGCAIIMNSVIPVNAKITGCLFEKNFALSYGGGMYLAWTSISDHTTVLANCLFIENECPEGGAGGLEMGFSKTGPQNQASKLLASDLQFIGNKAAYGGAAYVFIGCKFMTNIIIIVSEKLL